MIYSVHYLCRVFFLLLLLIFFFNSNGIHGAKIFVIKVGGFPISFWESLCRTVSEMLFCLLLPVSCSPRGVLGCVGAATGESHTFSVEEGTYNTVLVSA